MRHHCRGRCGNCTAIGVMNYRTLSLPAVLLALASPVFAQNSAKIDEELTRSVKAGCTTEKVIITTRPGYRAGLADSLQRHGDRVKFQHVSIDAVSAEIHCGDIETLSGFSSVRSEEHTSELHSPRDLPSSPTRRSSDLETGGPGQVPACVDRRGVRRDPLR